MSIKILYEFLFVCEKAGFKSVQDVQNYLLRNGMNAKQLFSELCDFMSIEFL